MISTHLSFVLTRMHGVQKGNPVETGWAFWGGNELLGIIVDWFFIKEKKMVWIPGHVP